ncbi:hypothetical protein QE452_001217 [Sphingomonas sp. SORGH_AS438]|nr:hypothetical protein [Sphingomonas sp. SORGH_AS_0438]
MKLADNRPISSAVSTTTSVRSPLGQPAGGAIERGDGPGDAPGQPRGTDADQRQPDQSGRDEPDLDRAVRRHRPVHRIGEEQRRLRPGAHAMQWLQHGEALLAGRRQGEHAIGRRSRPDRPVAVHPARPLADEDAGGQGDRGQAFESAHLLGIEGDDQDDPADLQRSQDRRGDDAVRPPPDSDHRIAPIAQRVTLQRGKPTGYRPRIADDAPIHVDQHGIGRVGPRAQAGQRGDDGRGIAAGHGRAETEIARQDIGRSHQRPFPLLPQTIIDAAARRERICGGLARTPLDHPLRQDRERQQAG